MQPRSIAPGVLALTLVVLAAGCGNDSRETSLQISVVTGQDGPAQVALTCDPASGTLPDPAAACAAIAGHSEMISPRQMTATCVGTVGIPPEVSVRGTANGHAVDLSVRDCDLPLDRAESARLWLGAVGLG